MAKTIGEELAQDFMIYTQQMVEQADAAAKEVQKDMKKQIKPVTPYRDYTKTGPEDRVAREIADKKGHLKDKWTTGQIKTRNKGSAILKMDSKYYAVRSSNKPMLVHLLNFPHRIVLWGRPTNRMTVPKNRNGNAEQFVDKISEKGQQELDQKLVALGLKRGNP